MKRIMIGLSAVIFSGCLFAQTSMEKQVVVKFQQDFNTAAYEKIYQQFIELNLTKIV